MPIAARILSCALACAVAAGCGGGSGGGEHYSADATASCLAENGASVDPGNRVDVLAIRSGAEEGAVRAKFGSKELILSFSADADAAQDVQSAYEPFSDSNVVGDLERKGNAVLAWTDSPSDDERQTAEDCLR